MKIPFKIKYHIIIELLYTIIAIRIAGEQAVRDRITKALELFKRPNEGYQLKNLCRCLLA
jgi:hypothetical protein